MHTEGKPQHIIAQHFSCNWLASNQHAFLLQLTGPMRESTVDPCSEHHVKKVRESFLLHTVNFTINLVGFLATLWCIAVHRPHFRCHTLAVQDALPDIDNKTAAFWTGMQPGNASPSWQADARTARCNATDNQTCPWMSWDPSQKFAGLRQWWCFVLKFIGVYDCDAGSISQWDSKLQEETILESSMDINHMCNTTQVQCSPQMTWHLTEEGSVSTVRLWSWSSPSLGLNNIDVYVGRQEDGSHVGCNVTTKTSNAVARCPDATSSVVSVRWTCIPCNFSVPSIFVQSCSKDRGLRDLLRSVATCAGILMVYNIADSARDTNRDSQHGQWLWSAFCFVCLMVLGCWMLVVHDESLLVFEKPLLTLASIFFWAHGIWFSFHLRLQGLIEGPCDAWSELCRTVDTKRQKEAYDLIMLFSKSARGLSAAMLYIANIGMRSFFVLVLAAQGIFAGFLQGLYAQAVANILAIIQFWSTSQYPILNACTIICNCLLVGLLLVLLLWIQIAHVCGQVYWMGLLTADEHLLKSFEGTPEGMTAQEIRRGLNKSMNKSLRNPQSPQPKTEDIVHVDVHVKVYSPQKGSPPRAFQFQTSDSTMEFLQSNSDLTISRSLRSRHGTLLEDGVKDYVETALVLNDQQRVALLKLLETVSNVSASTAFELKE